MYVFTLFNTHILCRAIPFIIKC